MAPEEIIKNIQFLGHGFLKIKLEGKIIFVNI